MFSLAKYLLTTQINASVNKGKKGNNMEKDCCQDEAWIIVPANNPPKKVLPTSPINTFEGDQLNIRKAKREETIIQIDGPIFIADVANAIINEEVRSPSIPSTKFVKFIIEVITKATKK